MKITDILEIYSPLATTSASMTATPQAYGGMVRQAVSGQPSPTNPYQGLGQLRGTGAPDLPNENPLMPGAPPVPDQQPAEASPGMRNLMPPPPVATAAFEAADWTITFGDLLALYEA